jgi:hypothetical protein
VSDFITALAERIRSDVDLAEDHPEDLRLYRLYALLALVKGAETTREDVHNAWIVWMVEIDGDHDALTPFADLSEEQREQDQPFLEAIQAATAAGLVDEVEEP